MIKQTTKHNTVQLSPYEYDDQHLFDEENGKGVAPHTKGYFPSRSGRRDYNNVGVTIATGVDLGTKTVSQLLGLGVSQTIVKKLEPFMGLKGSEAEKNAPNLKLTADEANELSKLVVNDFKLKLERGVERLYPGQFASLSKGEKTILLSIKYQYGTVSSFHDDFLDAIMRRDYVKAESILLSDHFFANRRKGQVALLRKYRNVEDSTKKQSQANNSIPPPNKNPQSEEMIHMKKQDPLCDTTDFEKMIYLQSGITFSDSPFSFAKPLSFKDNFSLDKFTHISNIRSLLEGSTGSENEGGLSHPSLGKSSNFQLFKL